MEDWNKNILEIGAICAIFAAILNFVFSNGNIQSWIWPGLAGYYMWQYKKFLYDND